MTAMMYIVTANYIIVLHLFKWKLLDSFWNLSLRQFFINYAKKIFSLNVEI